MNYFSSRSGYSFSLHPIAPCVLASFTGPKPIILTGAFFNKYNKSLLSGTLAVTSEESSLWETGISMNFLERKIPYVDIVGESGRFDSCLELRQTQAKSAELIPEFYGEPAFLLGNKNKVPVVLPKFAQDPFQFVSLQRKLIESEEVSAWMPKWFDSSFGIESKAFEISRTAFSESTFLLTHQENQDPRHVRLFSESHPKRRTKEESRRRSMFENNQQWNFYEQESEFSSGKILFVSASQNTNKIAVLSEKCLLIYESILQSKRDQYQAVQGLYVDQDVSIPENFIAEVMGPFEFIWNQMIILAVDKKSPSSLSMLATKDRTQSINKLTESSIVSLKTTVDSLKALVGTDSGECLLLDFSKASVEIISRVHMGSLPFIHRVVLSLTQVVSISDCRTAPIAVSLVGNHRISVINYCSGETLLTLKIVKVVSQVHFALTRLQSFWIRSLG